MTGKADAVLTTKIAHRFLKEPQSVSIAEYGILDADAAAIGTWIESTEFGTSGEGNVGKTDIKDAGGTSLPASLQLEDEVIP